MMAYAIVSEKIDQETPDDLKLDQEMERDRQSKEKEVIEISLSMNTASLKSHTE